MQSENELIEGDIFLADSPEGSHVKEVYARFGLAMYHAQVLEHGLVNALTILDLVPARRGGVRDIQEWERELDAFMDRHFETTMGRMIANLRQVTHFDAPLEEKLRDALTKRNRLAHAFFRYRAQDFMSAAGRHEMLVEIDEANELFEQADSMLADIVAPVRRRFGLTDERIAEGYAEMLRAAQGDPDE